jgi:hypothetical protein
LLALHSVDVLGQEFRATVTGRITDPEGLAVPGVTVTALNEATKDITTAVTNRTGNYTISYLRPGMYVIKAELQGFVSPQARQELVVGQTLTLNLQMKLGMVTETVIVEAAAIEMSKADRGMVIANTMVNELPLNARNPFMLSTLAPGVTYNGGIYYRPFDNGAIGDWSINGGTNRNNEFLLDGAPNNSIQQGTNMVAYVPPVDSVQEFKIMTNTYDAQYGRSSGGTVNVSLKSGTNTLHGAGYEYARRFWLDANTYLNGQKGVAKYIVDANGDKTGHYVDQFGFQLDGPVRIPGLYNGKDRTFFMFSFEDYQDGLPSSGATTYPTEQQRNGDFSNLRDASGNLIVIYDPATTRLVNGQTVRDPFPGNIIPANRINPIAKKVLSYFPAPNTSTPGSDPWRNNFVNLNLEINSFYNYVGKVDHNFGPNDKMYVRYAYNVRDVKEQPDIFPPPLTDNLQYNHRVNNAAVVDYLHTFGSSTTLNLRASFNRYVEGAGPNSEAQKFDATTLGYSSALVNQLPLKIFPVYAFADYGGIGRGNFRDDKSDVYTFQPNITTIRGAHSIRAGLDMRYTRFLQLFSGYGGMTVSASRTFTQKNYAQADALSGNSMASFLLGAVDGSVDVNPYPTYIWSYYAPWVQDDWKISNRLTLNLGFRWDLTSPVTEKQNRINYGFDTTAVNPVSSGIDQSKFPGYQVKGGIGFAGVNGNPTSPYRWDKNNIQPRLGASFILNDKTVIRGGVGRYFLNPLGRGGTSASQAFAREGFSVTTPMISSVDGNRTARNSLSDPFPNGVSQAAGSAGGLATDLGKTFSFSNPDFETPYVDQFSIGFQRQLSRRTSIDLSYVGSRTLKGQDSWTAFNEPSLAFRNLCDPTMGGSVAYCNQLLPNPFYQVKGLEGTTRFTSPTLSRYELARPYPEFGAITQTERNGERVWYDSMQLTLTRRMSGGLMLNGTYTLAKMIEQNGYMDPIAGTVDVSPYSGERRHRVTIAGVYQLPFGHGRHFLNDLHPIADGLIGGWEVAGSWIFQSGAPWTLPSNVVVLKDAKNSNPNTVPNIIQGVIPCVSQMNNDGTTTMLAYSVAYGCTEPYFLVQPSYAGRVTSLRDSNIRNPVFYQFDLNFAKTVQLRGRARVQLRIEVFNVLNQANYSTRNYGNNPLTSSFGQINTLATGQGNEPREAQIGIKLLF